MKVSERFAESVGQQENDMKYAYFEGRIVPLEEAKISIRTHAFLYGTSLFEGIRAYWLPETRQMSIFRMKEHYERLLRNGKLFFLTPALSLQELCDITCDLLRKNRPNCDLYIRPTVYKADEVVKPSLDNSRNELCIWVRPFGAYLDLSKGLSVCVSTWRRSADNAIPSRAKAGGGYMNTALAVTDAHSMGFDDAIFLTAEGSVAEGSAMNLFILRDGKLVTPSKTEDILEGITRDTIITLARNELGIEVEERVIDRSELYYAEEAFFCGTGAQVAPITAIDNRPVGNGQVGPETQRIQKLYFDVVKNKLPKYQHWCTLVDIDTP
ncbi:MAG TPA: branched-chain amino acid transaminase [Oculatellaceae cyanobacterium]|jgi:branched-chain amino acid aminotransferase